MTMGDGPAGSTSTLDAAARRRLALAMIGFGVAFLLFGAWRLLTYRSGDPDRYLWAVPRRAGESDREYEDARVSLEKAEEELERDGSSITPQVRSVYEGKVKSLQQQIDGIELHRGQDTARIAGREFKIGGLAFSCGLALIGLGAYRLIRPGGEAAG